MFDFLHGLFSWVERRWKSANWALKVVYLLFIFGLLVAISLTAPNIPGFDWFKDFFSRAGPESQSAVLALLMLLFLTASVFGLRQSHRSGELKGKLDSVAADRDRLQASWDRLQIASSHFELWKRDCLVSVPPFVPANQRKTRFVTMLNLKGGVGKTTLTANLAACLSLADPPKRVLLIDIDFQGTLSDATVDKSLIEAKRAHDAYVHQLLLEPVYKPGLIDQLAVPMNRIPSTKVFIAREQLDNEDYRSQARFFVDPSAEPRFQFRKHLHREEIFAAYDYVIFDCPPRITTSVVNALFCSDYVLIPSKLDKGSIESVPRTLSWLKVLGPHCPAELLGVVVSQVSLNNRGQPTVVDAKSYEYLRATVERFGYKDRVFKACVPTSSKAVGIDHGIVASVDPKNRSLFHPVVLEFVRRMAK